jgi:hypothetical protein
MVGWLKVQTLRWLKVKGSGLKRGMALVEGVQYGKITSFVEFVSSLKVTNHVSVEFFVASCLCVVHFSAEEFPYFAEGGVGGIAHPFEKDGFGDGDFYAMLPKAGEGDSFVFRIAGGDGIGRNINLVPLFTKVQGRLEHADVRFDTGEKNLFFAAFLKGFHKVRFSGATEGAFRNYRNALEMLHDFLTGGAEFIGQLFGDKGRDFKGFGASGQAVDVCEKGVTVMHHVCEPPLYIHNYE